MKASAKKIAKVIFDGLMVFSSEKYFFNNSVIGNAKLNKYGLHIARILLAQAFF